VRRAEAAPQRATAQANRLSRCLCLDWWALRVEPATNGPRAWNGASLSTTQARLRSSRHAESGQDGHIGGPAWLRHAQCADLFVSSRRPGNSTYQAHPHKVWGVVRTQGHRAPGQVEQIQLTVPRASSIHPGNTARDCHKC